MRSLRGISICMALLSQLLFAAAAVATPTGEPAGVSVTPPPQAFKATVHFMPGIQQQIGPEPATVGTLSTNLLGALLSKPIKTVGSDDLAKYVSNNVSVGTAIPLDEHSRITAEVGLGLGQHVIRKKVTLWPFVSLVQFDSTDNRVPRDILASKPGQKTWSAPQLNIGFVFTGDYDTKIKGNKLFPIVSVGVRLPYYFPDDPFAGLAGLFSSRRDEFKKEGGPTLVVEFAIPLRGGEEEKK